MSSAPPVAVTSTGQSVAPVLPAVPGVRKGPKRIGDVLIEEGFINQKQLERALQEGKATAAPLGSVLIKLGFIDEVQLGKGLAKLHGLQYIDTSNIELIPEVMKLIPQDFMKRHMIVPLRVSQEYRRLEVIMARPDNLHVLDEIALLTGYRPIPRVSTHKEMVALLDKFYGTHTSSDEVLARLEEDLSNDSTMFTETTASELEAEMAADDAPVVQLVNSLLLEAIECDASDVHIEPQKERLLIRFRIHGILKEVKSIPRKMAGAVTSRIKVASGMDIAERRRPQDGRMKIKAGSQEIDMRVNSLAVQFGEKIVIRLLKPNSTTGGLEKLGLPAEEVKRINKMIKSPHGIILVTGPTGSGKTTTLYSCLREINSPELNITTIEDPIEYPLAGVNQTQVSHKAGLSFALCLRAILRQDPDVVMVGEIRDEETMEAAIHAALTGHLVFSTLHTNSTAKTVTRLLEMGAPSYLVSSAVIGILAQRLVRRNCSKCKVSYEASEEELQILGIKNPDKPVILQKGTGCDRCGGSGYQGRIGLYEIMNMNREIGELIEAQASTFVIQDAAVKHGMLTLAMDGKRKIFAGLTTVEEVTRVLGLDLEES
ncbi:GspE/PulE family protein [Vampirovibrio chlorellavorus]|uniref:GspE/PulE family protein n=1 Tax=Vampirovibrio chlorellavorus TaxID=758823 RepID=UPI0026EA9007|nr:ATPase, T2SS/T4P/T4SS family [Vampirovibrio chlorellavorus]